MNQFKITILAIAINLAANAFAVTEAVYLNKLNHCDITTGFHDDYEPATFQPSNNLLRSNGGAAVYCGEKIIITGRVLDQNCVPISDAKIYLWQVACDGKFPYKTLRKHLDKSLINLENGSSFQGSGIATTNNEGRFVFITTLPTAVKGMPPHVNVRVRHYQLGSLETRLRISPSHLIKSIKDVGSMAQQLLPLLEQDTLIYNFDIVLPSEGINNY